MRRRAHDAISIIASAKISIFYSLPCFRCKLPRSRPSNRDGWDGERGKHEEGAIFSLFRSLRRNSPLPGYLGHLSKAFH